MTWSIRAGRVEDFKALGKIEIDAFESLVAAGAFPPGEGGSTSKKVLKRSLRDGFLFVAADQQGEPLGFVAATKYDDLVYIGEVDVARRHQGRGIGRALMQRAIAEAKSQGLRGAMLTTDRLAPFNGPFYQSLGFREVAKSEMPERLRDMLETEIENGRDPKRRVAMVLPFDERS